MHKQGSVAVPVTQLEGARVKQLADVHSVSEEVVDSNHEYGQCEVVAKLQSCYLHDDGDGVEAAITSEQFSRCFMKRYKWLV